MDNRIDTVACSHDTVVMQCFIYVNDAGDPRLRDYVRLTDVELRKSLEAGQGLFMAEGEKVIRRAVAAGYAVRSLLATERRAGALGAEGASSVKARRIACGSRPERIASLPGSMGP